MKRVWSLVALTGFLVLGTSAPAHAGSILYFWDNNIGYPGLSERMSEALVDPQVTSQHTVTFANTLDDFINGVDNGNYDLFILFLQQTSLEDYPVDGPKFNTAFGKVATAVANGKRAIVDDWGGQDDPLASFVPFTNTNLENGFGADYTGNIGGVAAGNDSSTPPVFLPANPTDTMTVQRPSLLFNLNASVSLYDPGWLVPFYGLTVPNGSTCAAYFDSNQDCAIVFGNNDRTIVNGFMNDTFRVNEQGKQLYINEINTLLPTPVPEPTSLVLIGTGLAAAAARLRRRSKQ